MTEAVIGFCETMEKAGYYVNIYGSDIATFDVLDTARLSAYDLWVARYPESGVNKHKGGMRQYSSTGRVTGITGDVDLDYATYDYPTIIKNKHLNGF